MNGIKARVTDIINKNLNAEQIDKIVAVNNVLKRPRILINAKKAEINYKKVIARLKESGRNRINFAAYVVYDSSYGMDGVFQLMMQDKERWNPTIVVIPDVSRGEEHKRENYFKTREFFVNKYGEKYVVDGWNSDIDEYYDYLGSCDIVYYANPYDSMVHEFHKIQYASKRDVLPIYVSYGYEIGRYTTLGRLRSPELSLVWKCFVDTIYTYEDYLQYQVIKGKNVVLTGYSKMDGLYNCPKAHNKKKRILITPHHTVSAKELPMSNFLNYYNLILRLPDIFPELNFVFRPHPLLFTSLINSKLWSKEKVEEYIDSLKCKGVEYSTGGDYLKIFAECDAIVNDCGSFTVEWLFTGKPGCFVYNKNLNEKFFTTLMNKAISGYSIARTEKDIIDFIKNIAEDKNENQYKMEKWVEENIAINYPSVSSFLLKELDVLNE